MYSIERKAEIITLLEQEGVVDVAQLADRFQVSKETIRRDLRDLEKEGIASRTHGGAVFARPQRDEVTEYPMAVRSMQRFEEKRQICKAAASLIQDGDTLFVDNSSSTLNLLRYIPEHIRVTIVTNSLQLMIESAKVGNPNIQLICLGGQFRSSNFSVYGYFSSENARSFYPNKSILSCRGIDAQGDLTDGSIYEVEIKRFMIERSKETILLADYTKFDQTGSIYITNLSHIHHIITDDKVSDSIRERLGDRLIVTKP